VQGRVVLAVLALLIVYGSTYPFDFAKAEPDALRRLFSDWRPTSTRGDMLGNMALFVPWGLAGILSSASHVGTQRAVLVTAVSGLVLALGSQIAQVWLPSRNAALADVLWNMLGIVVGLVVGWRVRKRLAAGNPSARAASVVTVCLLGAWLLAYWLPLVPSLDLQLLKDNFRLVLSDRGLSIEAFMPGLAMALMSGYLLSRLMGVRASLLWLPAWLALAAFGQLFIVAARVGMSAPLGFIAGTLLWWASAWVGEQRRIVVTAVVLIAAYSLQALSPFEFRDVPGTFGWLPLAAMLEGSMLSNVHTLVDSLLIFASFLYLVEAVGGRPAVASAGLAVWALGIEIIQMYVETRTADITLPLLVILMGQAFRMLRPVSFTTEPLADASRPEDIAAQPVRSVLQPLLAALTAVALIATGLHVMLRLPSIPYNVRELFLGDGHPLALVVFSLAMLWAGAGAYCLAEVVTATRRPAWMLPPTALAVSLISLLLLSASVTSESIEDISGSSNLYWFVTNKDTWGVAWRSIFLRLDAPELISFLERCVRYAALYAPLPIVLGLMIAVQRGSSYESARPSRLFGVLISAVLTLWLCKAIAFDWSSTDNLNELIARDGSWGWGGGGYLYMLLMLICLNSLVLAASMGGLLGGALFTVFAMPLGWWLLNQGLEPAVEKYDIVFSGAQFLLGPDRSHALPVRDLFVRWVVVQAGVTLIIATGTWLGLAIFARSAHGGSARRTDVPSHTQRSTESSAIKTL